LPYNPALTVADYLLAAGGVNPLTADPNGLYFVDKLGGRTRTSPAAQVEPGALLFVDRNAWTKTTRVLGNISLVAGVITAVFTATSYVLSVIRALQ
jgi:protein involved in polysaccharide export with SLBB domain